MAVIGIDFGNLNCVLAQAERGGVKVLLNENSQRQNSSLVSFQGGQRFLGESATPLARSNYKNTISAMKRMIGRQYDEPEMAYEMAWVPGVKFVKMGDGGVGVEVMLNDEPKQFSMTQIVSMMLVKCGELARQACGVNLADAVVSIPCWFSNAQRLAMKDASEIAGVHCLRLMHDTTATAVEYGIYKSAKNLFDATTPQTTMFIDLGHSSYSVSVVDFVTGKLTVKSTAFDRSLGGREFDMAIAKWLGEEFAAKYKCANPFDSPKPWMKLQQAAEKAKKSLSPAGVTEASMFIECLAEDRDFSISLKVDKFEELVAPLLARLTPPIAAALEEAGVTKEQLSAVEIVGGGTRVNSVKKTISAFLGLDQSKVNYGLGTTMNADEAVSKGCALAAAMLSTRFKVKEFAVIESVTYPVRVSWEPSSAMDTGANGAADEDDEGGDDAMGAEATNSVVLFGRNSDTPKTRRITFRRSEPFTIAASYDEAAMPMLPPGTKPSIAEFTVKVTPPADGELPRIRVHLKHSLDGIIEMASAQLMEEVIAPPPAPAPAAPEPAAEGKEGDAGAAGAPADGDKMDTSSDAKAGGDEPAAEGAAAGGDEGAKGAQPAESAPPPKKKFRKIALGVDVSTAAISKKAMDDCIELEAQLQQADRIIIETGEKRNELESFIYAMRDEIIGELRPFVSDADKGAFEDALNGAEEWLYNGDGYDTTKSKYVEKLGELQKLSQPITERKFESTARPAAVDELRKEVEDYKKWANTQEEKYAHISEADRAKVKAACKDAEGWVYDMLEKQGDVLPTAPPAFRAADVAAKKKALIGACKPIKTQAPPPPPAPEKKEEPPAEEKAADGDAKAPEGKDADEGKDGEAKPMETDEKPSEPPADAPAEPSG